MTGFFSYLVDMLLPSSCLRCGERIVQGPAGLVLPPHWPSTSIEFFGACSSLCPVPGFTGPARLMCTECWLTLEPAPSPVPLLPGIQLAAPFLTNDTLLVIIHYLKFSGGRAAVQPLSWWMAYALEMHHPSPYPDLLFLPVPLHPARVRERGYNQAALLAERTAQRFGATARRNVLVRHRRTKRQTSLVEVDRAANVRGAFALAQPGHVTGRNIVLVDDLVTTGETARACAGVLAAALPASITALSAGRPYSGLRPPEPVSGGYQTRNPVPLDTPKSVMQR